jgi:hypothetical protein
VSDSIAPLKPGSCREDRRRSCAFVRRDDPRNGAASEGGQLAKGTSPRGRFVFEDLATAPCGKWKVGPS